MTNLYRENVPVGYLGLATLTLLMKSSTFLCIWSCDGRISLQMVIAFGVYLENEYREIHEELTLTSSTSNKDLVK